MFGEAGQFEKVIGIAHGEVDPRDPLNAIVQDIALAPRNVRGMVEYNHRLLHHQAARHGEGQSHALLRRPIPRQQGGRSSFNIATLGGTSLPTRAMVSSRRWAIRSSRAGGSPTWRQGEDA